MTDISDQYRIIASGAGWADRSAFGRVRVEGGDAVPFLHALVTNDVAALAQGHGLVAAFLTPQGRMTALARVFHRGSHLLLEVEPGQAAPLAERLDQSIFAEDVSVVDVTASTFALRVVGRDAARVVTRALGLGEAAEAALSSLPPLAQVDAGDPLLGDRFVALADDSGLPAFDVLGPAEAKAGTLAAIEEAGAAPVDASLVEALRIAAGRPRFGVDMTTETIPLEAGLLDRAISTTKGCYPGQEVIIRVLHRGGGRVAKRLVRIAFPPDVASPPAPGARIEADGRDVGRITSAAWSPAEGHAIALGYVTRETADARHPLQIDTPAGPTRAEITGVAT